MLIVTKSGSVVLPQPGSMSMSVAPVTPEGCVDAQDMGSYLRPCCCQVHSDILVCPLLRSTISGSVLMSVVPVITGCVLKSEGHAELVVPLAESGRSGPAPTWLLQRES